jgi:hypothetical protein
MRGKKSKKSKENNIENCENAIPTGEPRIPADEGGISPESELTQAKREANKKNAKKSSGPRTVAGKLTSSRNAVTHGFFARQLVLNDRESRQLDAIRRTLRRQLLPETILQEVAFEEITCCMGRCMLALGLEMCRVTRMLRHDGTGPNHPHQPDGPSGTASEWYLSGKQGLREGMRLLEVAKQEFLSLGRIDEKWNATLDEVFGPKLREIVSQWLPPNESVVLLAHQLSNHVGTYGGSLPRLGQAQGSESDGERKPEVILDPEQSKHMVLKLFELEASLLSDLWKSSERRASEVARAQADAVDFVPRYFPTACRDLHRAVDWFMQLKNDKH